MSDQPWTIERISEALSSPDLTTRFLGEINRAPAADLLSTFAKWQAIAESISAGVERAREIVAAQLAGETVPGEWEDVTDQVRSKATELRSRSAA
ncbi:hypothetical protein ACGF0D_41230 [Kitasatospora sp. NPDC048298]|uniref:hypothetical protein n=1 Tax=Kitasatospora sp. NPDC048298 TaxID=3364049 RepID=UPI0037230948